MAETPAGNHVNKPASLDYDGPLTLRTLCEYHKTAQYKEDVILDAVRPILAEYTAKLEDIDRDLQQLKATVVKQSEELARVKCNPSSNNRLTQASLNTTNAQQGSDRLSNLRVKGLTMAAEDAKAQFISMVEEKMAITIDPEEITVRMPLQPTSGPNPQTRTSAVVTVIFTNIWTRRRVYQNRMQFRGTDIFISEDLNQEQANLAFLCREKKKSRLD